MAPFRLASLGVHRGDLARQPVPPCAELGDPRLPGGGRGAIGGLGIDRGSDSRAAFELRKRRSGPGDLCVQPGRLCLVPAGFPKVRFMVAGRQAFGLLGLTPGADRFRFDSPQSFDLGAGRLDRACRLACGPFDHCAFLFEPCDLARELVRLGTPLERPVSRAKADGRVGHER
jgi:hypothetical protein